VKPNGPNADPKKAQQVIEKVGAILSQIRAICDPTMIIIPTGVDVLMSLGPQNHESLKRLMKQLYWVLKETYKQIFKCRVNIIDGVIQTSSFELRIEGDIHQVIDRGNKKVIKHRSVEKTLYTSNYYEACFLGYLLVFWEVAIFILEYRPTNSLKLTDFLELFLEVSTQGLSYKSALMVKEDIVIKSEGQAIESKIPEMNLKIQ
jgi:hypothetical protein